MANQIRVSLSVAVLALIEAQGLDQVRIESALATELGKLSAEDLGQVRKISLKPGTKARPVDTLTIKANDKTSAKGDLNAPLRFWVMSERLAELETIGVHVNLNGWPVAVNAWCEKFKVNTQA